MKRKPQERKPPRVYWIRVEVDPEIPRPDAYVGSLVDYVRGGIHTQKANQLSNETLLSLIEVAIASEVMEATEDTESGPHAGQAPAQALDCGSDHRAARADHGDSTGKAENKTTNK